MDEVKANRKNIFCIWLDYKKAFDSVSHPRLIKSLELAKVPTILINAITRLTRTWSANAYLSTNTGNIESGTIEYKRGILQGDALSVILFILQVNPASFLLENADGYKLGKLEPKENLSHLFFVDGLKLHAINMDTAKLLLDIITTFTKDVGMSFGEQKCAYVCVKRGKRKSLGKSIEINGLKVKELQEEELYTYLGQDEAVGYDGVLNKEKVTKEYQRRVRKIWTSELYSGNKVTAHNTFAVPLIIPMIGILNWTRKEIEDLDKATRRIMCYTGNLHMRSDINRIYVPRKLGGRGLTSIEDSYTARMFSLAKHIKEAADTNAFMKKVKQHEQENIIRLKDQLLEYHNIKPEEYTKQAVKTKLKQDHMKAWKNKPLHRYLFEKIEADDEIDQEASNQWLHSGMSSHVEGYINAMQEQEIATKATKKRRNKDQTMNSKCRLCETQEETVLHVLGACPSLSTNLYISARHDNVEQIIVEEVLKQ